MATEVKHHEMISIYVDQHERLLALSRATRVPMAVYIREGIDLLLDRERRERLDVEDGDGPT